MSKSDTELIFPRVKHCRKIKSTSEMFAPLFPDVDMSLAQLDLYKNFSDVESVSTRSTGSQKVEESNEACTLAHRTNSETLSQGHSSPSRRANPRGCLFIAGFPNLPEEEVIKEVYQHFSKWGQVDNIKLTCNKRGTNYGFVYFKDFHSIESFLRYSTKIYIDNVMLRVEDAYVNRSFYLLPTIENEIKQAVIDYVKVIYFPEEIHYEEDVLGNQGRGAHLVRFKTWKAAIFAYQGLASYGWKVEWGCSFGQSGQIGDFYVIYVSNLNPDVVEERHLMEHFQKFGTITSTRLIHRAKNSYAFVRFLSPYSTFVAIQWYNQTMFLERVISVQHYYRNYLIK